MKKILRTVIAGAAAAGTVAAFLQKYGRTFKADVPHPVRLTTGKYDRSQQWVPPPKPESNIRNRKPLEEKVVGKLSFFVGIRNPKTLELSLRYDDFRYEWQVYEEYFRVPTLATQVGFIFGEDVSLQIEMPDFLGAASFEELMAQVTDRFGALTPVTYGEWTGYTYVDGDVLRAALRIDGAEDYYLLVTIIKEHKSDTDYRELGGNIDVVEMISSIQLAC